MLGATGLAKLLAASGSSHALDILDPLIGIPFRQLMALVGVVELLIAFLCLFTERRWLSVVAVCWMATSFLVYRVGLWLLGWHGPCGCMGSLTTVLHLSPHAADSIMKAVLAYLLIGSYAAMLSQGRWGRRRGEGFYHADARQAKTS